MTDETLQPEQDKQAKSLTLGDAAQVARASAGLALQEAVNLGEINPAMARRFGERMDQLNRALMSGAGIQWDPSNGSLKIVWPEVVNPILAAAEERKRNREAELLSSTAVGAPE